MRGYYYHSNRESKSRLTSVRVIISMTGLGSADLAKTTRSIHIEFSYGLLARLEAYVETGILCFRRIVRGFIRRKIVQGGVDPEDVVQETLLAIHVKRHTWRQD
ncbi:hypothetical protein BQ8482_810001 [Mesorhizobium delmotii]|uniref:Uncharacterized protein n=1 Tax=Mesorhizobium delmotii TaxID=1631247 RepID=A0A2P9AWP2_9HYPH|nr:hypothetical protein BQ8482_810001 [Mesorhizobium delmotii]